MVRRSDSSHRLDEAARAGWLYYVAGRTQDDIASIMGISRQSAQRLVSLSVSERLIKVRLDHPIAGCLDLAQRLRDAFDLAYVDVVPDDPLSASTTVGIAEAGAEEMERWLKRPESMVMAVGSGRTLKAAIDQLPPLACPQHRIVSLTGSIAPDGTAAHYNVIFSMADTIDAPHFPMPLPVLVSSSAERDLLHGQASISSTLDLAARADVAFVGIGELGGDAPLIIDGFMTETEMRELLAAGGCGEICGWIFDGAGRLLAGDVPERVASAPLPSRETCVVIGIAKGRRKHPAIAGAIRGRLINGLITDESAARYLLEGADD